MSAFFIRLLLFTVLNYNYLVCARFYSRNPDDCESPSNCDVRQHLESERKVNGDFVPKVLNEQTTEYWHNKARNFVDQQSRKERNENVAKNIILYLGDGMGISTQTAARAYMGGEEKELTFELFPNVALSKTYCVDSQVADSACTSTAYTGGVKANKGTIGVNGYVKRYNCQTGINSTNHVASIAEWAMKAGKDVGFVTTTRVTDASPAGLYAKTANRDWENDAEIRKDGCNPEEIDDIAKQLVHGEIGKKFKVIFGGGRSDFLNETLKDEDGKSGKRKDGRNLIEEWKSMPNSNRQYVWDKSGLQNINVKDTDQVLGLFAPSHCPYQLEIVDDKLEDKKPTLPEMVDKAIEILMKNPNGFYLFVEGGRIDHAHHDNYARYSLEETLQFSKAVQVAEQKLKMSETLMVVTADHSHSFSYGGKSQRGANILDVTNEKAGDGMHYYVLGYANGPGYANHFNKSSSARIDPEKLNYLTKKFRYPATVHLAQETHGGEDVGIYANGPWSHLYNGVMEQHMIPHVMAYASCIGMGSTACNSNIRI